ncbi:hypothetical protein F5144DRAFT_210834 [Chaetomium tenue]|uniref:Uncharacterized protein n=1 Tax=Chaetomium tenue TaxID=1854479 RepID=A0ACB7PDM0_9PEZI|nr:hypothetical protein F5144DRAFT_210834 [Chaetomium globosum]
MQIAANSASYANASQISGLFLGNQLPTRHVCGPAAGGVCKIARRHNRVGHPGSPGERNYIHTSTERLPSSNRRYSAHYCSGKKVVGNATDNPKGERRRIIIDWKRQKRKSSFFGLASLTAVPPLSINFVGFFKPGTKQPTTWCCLSDREIH